MLWLKQSKYECYQYVHYYVINLLVLFVRPLSIMDTVLPPFLTACKRFDENTISIRIKLIKRLFYHFILNQANAFLPNPFWRGCPHLIGRIQRYHAVGGANGITMVVMFVGLMGLGRQYFPYYSYCRNPMGREFFVPARTLIGVKLCHRASACIALPRQPPWSTISDEDTKH